MSDRHDSLFTDPSSQLTEFRFDADTAAVFDDMAARSVPFYGEIQRMIAEISRDFCEGDTRLYDLGCATGNTLCELDRMLPTDIAFVGIDNSPQMLHRAREKLACSKRLLDLREADLHQDLGIDKASVVILNLTLQFVRPLYRQRLLDSIHAGLQQRGALILVEKINLDDSLFNRLFMRYYYDLKKRQGYSEVEITRKREALENVLIPYRPEENRAMLAEAGFTQVEEFFRWYNFSAILAVR